jgi:hypothetical protein
VSVGLDFRLRDPRDLARVGDQHLADGWVGLVVEPPRVRRRFHDEDIAGFQVGFRPGQPFIQQDTPWRQDDFLPSVHPADDEIVLVQVYG